MWEMQRRVVRVRGVLFHLALFVPRVGRHQADCAPYGSPAGHLGTCQDLALELLSYRCPALDSGVHVSRIVVRGLRRYLWEKAGLRWR